MGEEMARRQQREPSLVLRFSLCPEICTSFLSFAVFGAKEWSYLNFLLFSVWKLQLETPRSWDFAIPFFDMLVYVGVEYEYC